MCYKYKSLQTIRVRLWPKSPFSGYASHASAATIRTFCTSVNKSQISAKSIYKNLRHILKHFDKSPKSSEFLNNAGYSTRMADFRDACVWAPKIILPFLDTLVTCSIGTESQV